MSISPIPVRRCAAQLPTQVTHGAHGHTSMTVTWRSVSGREDERGGFGPWDEPHSGATAISASSTGPRARTAKMRLPVKLPEETPGPPAAPP